MISTPTQYAERGQEIIILVGSPSTKSWWRNFSTERDVDVLVRGVWRSMTARAVGRDERDLHTELLVAYLARFPTAGRATEDGDTDAVVVWCRPRPV